MPERSKYEFYKEASLSQQLAHRHPEYADYAGSDSEISVTLATFRVLFAHGIMDPEDPGIELVYALLNEHRKALFATSEKVNEITKMGLQMPKAEDEFHGNDVDDESADH
jgi:hypothetical protein